MRLPRKLIAYCIVLVLVGAPLSGCHTPSANAPAPSSAVTMPLASPGNSPSPSSQPTPSPSGLSLLPGGDNCPVGILYMDPALNLYVMLMHPSWQYEKSHGQVYFANPNDKSGFALISISSHSMVGSFEDSVAATWQTMKDNMASMQPAYDKQKEITVGQGHKGVQYPYGASVNGVDFTGSATFWSAEGYFYICTASSNAEYADEVQAVFDGIMTSFKTIKEIGL